LPDVLVPALKAWHENHGKPREGAVFPSRHGERAGERKTGKHSYAQALRDALWAAGIVRPLPGFDNAKPDRKLCALQVASTGHKPVDFHSFRRAYNTALATAGVNVQVSMKLAGHKNPSTHMRYVLLAETLTTPEAALPRLTVVNGRADGLAVVPVIVETVKAACVRELPPANDTDQKFGINSAPPTGVEPVTFGLGIGQDSGIQANSSENTAILDAGVHAVERDSTPPCPAEMPLADVVGDALASALVTALNEGDFETYERLRAKLEDWHRGLR
jgi:hypothetical protein